MYARARLKLISYLVGSLILGIQCLPSFAGTEPLKWESPSRDYSIVISETSQAYEYRLTLFYKATELSHYSFEGNLISIYWSPRENYVAFNNHFGHRCWDVWILALRRMVL